MSAGVVVSSYPTGHSYKRVYRLTYALVFAFVCSCVSGRTISTYFGKKMCVCIKEVFTYLRSQSLTQTYCLVLNGYPQTMAWLKAPIPNLNKEKLRKLI